MPAKSAAEVPSGKGKGCAKSGQLEGLEADIICNSVETDRLKRHSLPGSMTSAISDEIPGNLSVKVGSGGPSKGPDDRSGRGLHPESTRKYSKCVHKAQTWEEFYGDGDGEPAEVGAQPCQVEEEMLAAREENADDIDNVVLQESPARRSSRSMSAKPAEFLDAMSDCDSEGSGAATVPEGALSLSRRVSAERALVSQVRDSREAERDVPRDIDLLRDASVIHGEQPNAALESGQQKMSSTMIETMSCPEGEGGKVVLEEVLELSSRPSINAWHGRKIMRNY